MRLRFVLYNFLLACLLTGAIYAQPQLPSKREILKQLKSRLDLTDEQAKKVELILSSSEKKIKELRDKMDEERENMMNQMDNVIDNQDKEIDKVLTNVQKKEYKEIKKERENMCPPMGERLEPPMDDYPRPPHDFE